jgi:hypothetical protein
MADIPVSDASRAVGTGSVLLTVGGLVAAFGVASCCGLPFLLATAGIGTAWLNGFALLAAPHRVFLLAVGAVCLAGGPCFSGGNSGLLRVRPARSVRGPL